MTYVLHYHVQAHREGGVEGSSTPSPAMLGEPRHRSVIQNTPKCTILKKKIQKISPQRGQTNMFWGPRENVSLGPAVALDGLDHVRWNHVPYICYFRAFINIQIFTDDLYCKSSDRQTKIN